MDVDESMVAAYTDDDDAGVPHHDDGTGTSTAILPIPHQAHSFLPHNAGGSEDAPTASQHSSTYITDTGWINSSDDDDEDGASISANMSLCPLCGASMPGFALSAHLRFHEVND